MRIALGADHAGFELKEQLRQHLIASGLQVDDHGTHSSDSVDYPDLARAVGEEVAAQKADFGILVCGTGIGMSMAANKIPAIRAANVTSAEAARLSREHNDANVLTLGARLLDPETATRIVDAWLATGFLGGRHQRRVEKIAQLEGAEIHRA